MAAEYRPSVLIADGQFIAIRFIESFGTVTNCEQEVVDKLKDDITFYVTMTSGHRHEVSVRKQMSVFSKLGVPNTVDKTYESILEKWLSYFRDMEKK